MYRRRPRPRKRLKGYVIEDRNVCRLCREGPDEELFGKFFVDESSGFSVHQYCMFFSSGLAQRGEDDEGFDGFLIRDIKKEISRSKRLRCNFCKKLGATIGCCDKGCPQAFHYKCGKQRGGLFQFFDSFNSFCLMHRPTQGVSLKLSSNQTCPICFCQVDWNSKTPFTEIPLVTPCCKMTWFHNSCLQRHAQSSGSHYFRCPICNNMDKFQEEMKRMGIFIPEQDASWETGDAFADLHSQYSRCDAKKCICPNGRKHNETAGEWHICLCDICGQAGTHVKCQHWRRTPREWYCDVCGDINPHSSTRRRKIGDRSMDLSCIDDNDDDDDDESSSAEDLDVNVCSVSDDEISFGIVRDGDAVGTSHTLRSQGSVEKLVREGASPMRKRPRLSLECTANQSPRFSGNKGHSSPSFSSSKEGYSNISLDTPTCSVTEFKDMPPEVLIAISDTIFSGVTGTIQGPGDMARECTGTKESETISMDSDTASEASVELIKIERKPELLDLKRRPIARREKKIKSETYTSSNELVSVAGSESTSYRKQDISTTTEKRGIDVVEADSSGFSVKVEEDTRPTASKVNLPVADSKQDDVDSDEDSCIITNVVKKPCPVGNDKFGMKCYLECCNPKFYCDYHHFLTSAKTKDLQITTVSSTSGAICDHFNEKFSQAIEQHSLSDQAFAGTDNEDKAQVCSVGTNTLPIKLSSRKNRELSSTETTTTRSLFPEGKIPVSSFDRNKKLSLRSKKSGSYHERSLKGFASLREDNMAVTHKCFR